MSNYRRICKGRVSRDNIGPWIRSGSEELGYHEIVSRDEALEKTIEWERANPPPDLKIGDFDYAAEDDALNTYQTRDRYQRGSAACRSALAFGKPLRTNRRNYIWQWQGYVEPTESVR